MGNDDFEDFTERAYRELLRQAKRNWAMVDFTTCGAVAREIIWRHDVDYSVHRARALARIEHEEGIRSTYFLLLHSSFYNLLDSSVAGLVREILQLGHAIGLHFDPEFYQGKISSGAELARILDFERSTIEFLFETPVRAFSWHNPTATNLPEFEAESLGGMVNAYGKSIRESYYYSSDSNGTWRHDRLPDLLRRLDIHRMQILTHPEWWVPQPLPPRKRILRATYGRARAAMEGYDSLLLAHGRPNIGLPGDAAKPDEDNA